MGLGDIVEAVRTLQDERHWVHPLIMEQLNRTEIKKAPGPTDWLGISRIPTWCPRAHVMAYRMDLPLVDQVDPIGFWRMDRGTAMHMVIQELWLGPTGFFLGGWQCPKCANIHGTDEAGVVTFQSAVPMPEKCAKCGTENGKWTRFRFVEPAVADTELWVRGNSDGLLHLAPHPVEVLDIKTTDDIDKVITRRDGTVIPSIRECPKPDHVVQLQWYLDYSGCRNGRLLYVALGAKDIADAMVEHPVVYDPKLMHAEKEKVRVIRQALQDPTRPVPDCPTQGKGIYGECSCVEVAVFWASRGR